MAASSVVLCHSPVHYNNNNNNNIRLIRLRQTAQPHIGIQYNIHTIVCHAGQQCNIAVVDINLHFCPDVMCYARPGSGKASTSNISGNKPGAVRWPVGDWHPSRQAFPVSRQRPVLQVQLSTWRLLVTGICVLSCVCWLWDSLFQCWRR